MLVLVSREDSLRGKDSPDLVIFEIFERNAVQPVEFLGEVFVQGEENPGPVDPVGMLEFGVKWQ